MFEEEEVRFILTRSGRHGVDIKNETYQASDLLQNRDQGVGSWV